MKYILTAVAAVVLVTVGAGRAAAQTTVSHSAAINASLSNGGRLVATAATGPQGVTGGARLMGINPTTKAPYNYYFVITSGTITSASVYLSGHLSAPGMPNGIPITIYGTTSNGVAYFVLRPPGGTPNYIKGSGNVVVR
jgi:hypothetical protein